MAPPMGMAGGSGAPPMPPPQVPDDVITIDKVMRLLRDEPKRHFRIDIETDSTIAGDEAAEKTARTEFITAITKMVETWGPIVTSQPVMAPLAAELMQFGARAFRVGRTLETVIEETAQKLIEVLGQPKPPPQPSPDEMIKLQGTQVKTQAEIHKAQIGVQQAQIDAQAKIQAVQMEAQRNAQDHAHAVMQGQQQAGLADQAARNDAASQMMKAQIEEMRFRRAVEAENATPKTTKG